MLLQICYFCMVRLQVTQLQSQLARKDADIASLADKLEAAVEAAANATRAAAAQQQQPGLSAAARGVADEEARKAVALAQTQVGSPATYDLAMVALRGHDFFFTCTSVFCLGGLLLNCCMLAPAQQASAASLIISG
jgi:hypothetical protein